MLLWEDGGHCLRGDRPTCVYCGEKYFGHDMLYNACTVLFRRMLYLALMRAQDEERSIRV